MRDVAPPPFDQVKQRLEQIVQAKKFRNYMDELMRSAKIEKFDQPAAAKTPGAGPATPAPAAPAAAAPGAAAAPATPPAPAAGSVPTTPPSK